MRLKKRGSRNDENHQTLKLTLQLDRLKYLEQQSEASTDENSAKLEIARCHEIIGDIYRQRRNDLDAYQHYIKSNTLLDSLAGIDLDRPSALMSRLKIKSSIAQIELWQGKLRAACNTDRSALELIHKVRYTDTYDLGLMRKEEDALYRLTWVASALYDRQSALLGSAEGTKVAEGILQNDPTNSYYRRHLRWFQDIERIWSSELPGARLMYVVARSCIFYRNVRSGIVRRITS